MTGADVRAARRLLHMSSYRLAALAGVPDHVVRHFEKTGRIMLDREMAEDRFGSIRRALERAGVIFGEEPGVKLRLIGA